jgi:hypothetical protein
MGKWELIPKKGENKMKKITIIALALLFTTAQLNADSTYNFYFNDDEKAEESKKQKKKAKKEEVEKQTRQDRDNDDDLSEDKISQLADEIAKKIQKQSQPLTGTNQNELAAIKMAKNQYQGIYYLSAGLGMETFDGHKGQTQGTYVLKAKLFPYLGFEGTLPAEILDNFSKGYRVGAVLEKNIFNKSAVSLNGGYIKRSFYLGPNEEMNFAIHTQQTDPYVGLGLRLRFNNLDVTAGINKAFEKDTDFDSENFDKDLFATLGVTYALF